LQGLLEKVTRAVELRFGCAHSETEELCDFVVAITLDVVKDEDRPRLRRERRDGLFEVEVCTGLSERLRSIANERVIRDDATLSSVLGAQVGQHGIHRESVQPGAEAALTAKARQLPPCGDEGALGQLLGAVRVGSDPQTHGMDARDMGPIELLERSRIAVPRTLHQGALVGGERQIHRGHDEACFSIRISHPVALGCRPRRKGLIKISRIAKKCAENRVG
jgi:hypothetical protein